MEGIAHILKQLLENILIATQFKDEVNLFSKDDKRILELGQLETITVARNSIVSIYLNPRITHETKTHIKRILLSFEDGHLQRVITLHISWDI